MEQHFTETANQNALISFFAQLMKYLPRRWLSDEDLKRNPRSNARKFTVWDQMVSLLFCHLAGCDSLREIEDGLVSAVGKLQHLSTQAMGRTTLAYANEHRSYSIARDLYFRLLQTYGIFSEHAEIRTMLVRSMRSTPPPYRCVYRVFSGLTTVVLKAGSSCIRYWIRICKCLW